MNNQNLIVTAIVTLIIGAAGGFFGGMQYQKMQTSTPTNQLSNRNTDGSRQFGNGQRGQGVAFRGGAVTGEILNTDDTSLTVKLADGSSKIVLLTATTTINKASTGSKADLTTGAKVAVFGMPNSDGSVTATNVQLNPTMGIGGMMREGSKPKNAGTKSADATEIVVSGKNFAFAPSAITVPVNQKTRIVFKNTDGMHDFRVDELKIATAVVQTGDSDWVEFTPTAAGTYKFYCSVGNHRSQGMEGTLIVK